MKHHSLLRAVLLLITTALVPACSDLDVGTQTTTTVNRNVTLQAPAISGSFQPGSGGTYDVTLTWADVNTLETNYRVDRASSPIVVPGGSNVQFYEVLPANSTQWNFNMSGGQTLYFRVVAESTAANVQSDHSNEVQITTPLLPGAPTLTTTLQSSDTIRLTWTAPTGGPFTGYRIERQQDGGTWSTLLSVGGTTLQHDDAGLQEDTAYCYRVYARNSDGEGPASNESCQSTPVGSSITLTTIGAGGNYVSLVVEPGTGIEHISHQHPSLLDVFYTRGTPGTYQTVTADPGPALSDVGSSGTALDLSAGNVAHIAAQHQNGINDLRYATGTFPTVTPQTIVSTGDVGRYPRLRVSPATGMVNITYVSRVTNPSFQETLNWIEKTGAFSWSVPDPIFTSLNIQFSDFAIHTDGTRHVAFLAYAGASSTLYHGQRTTAASSWTLTALNIPNVYQETMPSLAIDAAGFPHVAFNALDGTGFGWDLYHATNASGSWQVEPIDVIPGTDVGRYSSFVIDLGTGRMHVSFLQVSGATLKYARKDLAGTWVIKTLDPGGAAGLPTSIDVDAAGAIHIAYAGAGSLKTAVGSP